jgi:DNA-binding GntR family transcriptional regulator
VLEDTLDSGPRTSHRELWELVCTEIRNLIITGEFAPGERLVEATLADRFDVSRGPVRRALMELERMGLVSSITRRGLCVTRFSRRDIDELFAVTMALERMAAREAADEASPEQVARLFELLEDLDRAQQGGDPMMAIEADLELHRQLMEASGNRRLLQLWTEIAEEIRFVIAVFQRAFPDIEWANHNRPIIEAVAARDANLADQAVESSFMAAHAEIRALSAEAFDLYTGGVKRGTVR